MAPESSGLDLTLRLNGAERTLTVEPATTLLDALRERAGLTGTRRLLRFAVRKFLTAVPG